ncbi:hypothetical protein BDY17DRAFT_308288 [Neohortaea acidophila]|uniref:SMP-30/Gluconolactonase/LRE-like region domain-containing protein n=1 Tax=Neohortaea acidophila TaxID=245834 RepID=A0A6A6Q3T1_9PEZI|nr:uncharacterized protein BDY17DRAFT_308288 [Neohortaea acidophila]KAF2486942.1 hypothetical protein BDY17DRAFT_308288 [Neohortaea acidophila]
MTTLSEVVSQAIELQSQPLTDGLTFGESPRFHNGKLYVSDMMGRKIYTIDPRTGSKEVVVGVEQCPNGMAFLSDGSLIYSSMFDGKLYRLADGVSELYVDLASVLAGYPGDMVIDQNDRVYVDDVGSRVLHGEPMSPGRVIIVERDRSIRTTLEGTAFANGVAIDSSQRRLYLSASGARTVSVYDIDQGGDPQHGEVILDLGKFPDAKEFTMCDGLCIDAEDALWLSLLESEMFVRRDRSGRFTHVVHTDGHAVACALGGEDGKTLYMLTNTSPKERSLFEAMANRETRCTITTARVSVGRGKGRP